MQDLRHYINLVESYINIHEADRPKWTEKNIQDLKDMYDNDWSPEDMAAYFDSSVIAVNRALYRYYPDRDIKKVFRWTDTAKQQLIKLKQEKYTDQQIADHFGLNQGSVVYALHKFFPDREKIHTGHRGITMADAEKMTNQYKNGRGTRSLAAEYNTTHSNVREWIQKYCQEMGIDFKEIQQQFWANRPVYRAQQAAKKIVRPGTQDNLRSKGPGSKHRAGYYGKQY